MQPNSENDYVQLDGERYFRIANSQDMPDFFMSLVGASDHWMFISSQGALTAGRRDPDLALFPYGTDDQISNARGVTGSLTLLRFEDAENSEDSNNSSAHSIWEPFAPHDAGTDTIVRNLYKTPLGNKLVFEEINETRQLAFRYRWAFSETFGFVRSCRLENRSDATVHLELLDGLQNILPYGVSSEFIMRFSNLANAYKKNELVGEGRLGLFYQSSIPTDRAEPSEGLKATTVWQTGLAPQACLLSSQQVQNFRAGSIPTGESDIRGKAGAFLNYQAVSIDAGGVIEWQTAAEVDQDHSDVVGLIQQLRSSTDMAAELGDDIAAGENEFAKILASSDAMQCGTNQRRTNRHLSNTVFNVMRGGIPVDDYRVRASDVRRHLAGFNRPAFETHSAAIAELADSVSIDELRSCVSACDDRDLARLTREYLPLAFSRRHGDPTRPWNRFAIHLRSPDGSTNLNYQGNWRDIFQNWEALAISFPQFLPAMICRFVNATTADGYNPYKVTKDGFAWEAPAPNDPWANIGYWGDHQIIYLLKLLEWNQRFDPAELTQLLNTTEFVHANVPYRIRPFEDIKRDPQSTIEFDAELAAKIDQRVAEIGSDGKLLTTGEGEEIHRVTLLEKLLTLSLAKLSNFVPDGGIWLNTQRPEWNDANNALVGNGLSMVTTYYLYRWFGFLSGWLADVDQADFQVSKQVDEFFQAIGRILREHVPDGDGLLSPAARAEIVTKLGQAGSDYRQQLYSTGPTADVVSLDRQACCEFFDLANIHLERTIRNNARDDGLFHAYNLLNWNADGLAVEYLDEMLEGQVAVLSSGLLSSDEAVKMLDALRSSRLYRDDQQTYLLYPNKQLPKFLEKNNVPAELVDGSALLTSLLAAGDSAVVARDVNGAVHFHGGFKNANDLEAALNRLPDEFQQAVQAEAPALMAAFEDLFQHRQFTGRSGTFFAYEGLGSTYWHMVSKLGLAVAEIFFQAVDEAADADTIASLNKHYRAIHAGIGAEKTPQQYGAFPSDPYSHTPENAGVKQPGMTGQVKEDILSRFAELGVWISDGCVEFRTELFDRSELLAEDAEFSFFPIDGQQRSLTISAGSFAFTLCQTPVILSRANSNRINVQFASGDSVAFDGLKLDSKTSQKLFARTGEIDVIRVSCAAFS